MENNGFFEVIGDDGNEEVKDDIVNKGIVDQMTLDMFRDQAQEAGYSESDIEEAINRVDTSCKCYDDFERIIGLVIEDKEIRRLTEQKKQERIKASIRLELDNLKSIEDPVKHLESVIYKVYNTTAVNGTELICESKGNENIKLGIYEHPVYSLIMQIKRPWVADLVNKCLAKWEDNPVVNRYIMQYIDYMGIPAEDVEQRKADLINLLPDSIKQEASPDAYKQYMAVHLLMQEHKRDEPSANVELLSNEDDLVNFAANFENYAEDDVPFDAAISVASEDAYAQSASWADKVGSFVGKTISLKYNLACNIEDALRQGLGDHADDYLQNRERIKAQRAELKAKKQEIKHEQRMAELETKKAMYQEQSKAEQQQSQYQQQMKCQQQLHQRQSQSSIYDHRSVNFAPQLPLPALVGFGSFTLWLIIALFFGKTVRVVCGVGLVVFTFGFIRKHVGEPKAINLIIGGACVTVLGLLFGMM